MFKRQVERYDGFNFYVTELEGNQAHITASLTKESRNAESTLHNVYKTVLDFIQNNKYEILHEKIFGELAFADLLKAIRANEFEAANLDADLPYTFVEGRPVFKTGIAGLQVRLFQPTEPNSVWMISFQGKPVGRGWKHNGMKSIMLQQISGNPADSDPHQQTLDMFQAVDDILKNEGGSFRNVLRTWIYLDDILAWYDVFNHARNQKFAEFGLLAPQTAQVENAEVIYLPASTGIRGANPMGTSGVMDVFAVVPVENAVDIAPTSGLKQRSPYRYGSAFSRAMTLRQNGFSQILLSGTASIDESGKTVFVDDTQGQIKKTYDVVDALIQSEGGNLDNVTEATVFLKERKDIDVYLETIREMGISELPAVLVEADVCRSDLLFEIDAAISL